MDAFNFGSRLKYLRSIRNLTQTMLAEKVGVTPQYIGRLERGESTPTFKTLEKLCDALNTEAANLFLGLGYDDATNASNSYVDPADTRNQFAKADGFWGWTGIWSRDCSTGKDSWSATLHHLLGYASPSLQPSIDAFLDHVHPDDAARVAHILDTIFSGKPIINAEFRVVRKDKQQRVVLCQAALTRDAKGIADFAHITFIDVTSWRHLQSIMVRDRSEMEAHLEARTATLREREAELRLERQELQDLIDNMLEGLFRVDRDGVVILANKAAARLAGYDSPEGLIGQSMADLYAVPAVRDELVTALEEHGALHNFEFLLQRRDGRQTWVSANIKLVSDEAGEYLYTEGLFSDISKRKAAEEQLRIQSEMTASSRDLMALVGTDYRYMVVNDAYARSWRRPNDDFIGAHMADILGEDAFADVIKPNLDRALAGEPVRFNTWIDMPGHDRKFLDAIYSPFSQGDAVIGVLVNSRDITETKQDEERFRILFEGAAWSVFVHDLEGRFLDVNPHACQNLGYTREELLGMHIHDIDPDVHRRGDPGTVWATPPHGHVTFEARHHRKDGSEFPVLVTLRRVKLLDQMVIVAMTQDLTERKLAEQRLELDRERFEALYTLSRMADSSEGEISDTALNAIVSLTTSAVGYLYFMNDSETELTLHAWSTGVMAQCEVADYPQAYKIEETGLWGEAVRQRKPVINNDYESSPYKKGYPEGHVPINRHCNIPVFAGERIVAIAGVANKQADYTDDDIRIMQLIMDGMWAVIERKRLHAAVACNEAKYRRLFELEADAVFLVDNETTRIMDANAQASHMFGYSREELLGMCMTDLSAEPESTFQACRHAVSSQERRYRAKNGGEVFVEVNTSHFSWQGSPVHIAALRNVTDRKRVEEALRQSEERLKLALNSVNDGLWDWRVDTGEIFFSAIWYTMLGYEPGEFPQEFETWRRLVHPADLPVAETAIAEHLEAGTPFSMEFRMRDRDGSWIWILSRGNAVEFDGKGRTTRMIGTHADITSRKRAETILRESEQRHRVIFESSPLGMILFDVEGAIRDCNENFVQLMGSTREQLLGFNTARQSTPAMQKAIKKALTGQETVFEDSYTSITGGKTSYLHVKFNPVYPGVNPTPVIATLEDITRRKQFETELEEAKTRALAAAEAKSRFLANMSHEVRTPISGMMGLMQLLQDTDLTTDQAEYLSLAMRSGKQLTRLIDDILDISRIEAGSLMICEEPFDVVETVQSVRRLFTQALEVNDLKLHMHLDPKLPQRLVGDASRLQQVLDNLVNNSIKYTHEGAVSVEVCTLSSLVPDRCRILFVVTDTGVGIPDNTLLDMFTPFVQAGGNGGNSRQGVGLGLSIVRAIVERMNGAMAVESAAGEGTAVYLAFDFQVAGQDGEHVAPPVAATGTIEDLRILVAEDDRINRLAVGSLLRKHGCEVTAVEDGEQALAALREEFFDLVLMDVQMPVLDGMEAMRAIRAGKAGADRRSIPVIAVTAHAMQGDREALLAAGMDGYLSKPFDIEELLHIATECTNTHRTRKPN